MPSEPHHLDSLARQVVDAALKVHRTLGPGLLESVYEHCLAHELAKRGLTVTRQIPVPIIDDGERLEAGLRLDLLIEDAIIIEVKAVEKDLPRVQSPITDLFEADGKATWFPHQLQCAVDQRRHQTPGALAQCPRSSALLVSWW